MTREEYIKNLIKENGYNIKSFAAAIGVPYSTLLTMLNGSIGGAAVETVIKICDKLNIPVENLRNEHFSLNTIAQVNFTDDELKLIKKYRALDERGKATVDNTLEKEYEFVVAKSKDTLNAAG